MTKEDIAKRLINNDSLFQKIHVIHQEFDILPSDKKHYGACIEYQDLSEMREAFIADLVDSILDWIYSTEKYERIVREICVSSNKTLGSANSEIIRKAHQKFRAGDNSHLLIQGQMGELLLFHFIQRYMHAAPLLRKMPITTSSDHERFGADAIHYKTDEKKNIIILGEAKTYTSKYKFNAAFEDALESILNTYDNHKRELNLYVHEDFLDSEMDKVAESYLRGTMPNVEVQLVSIIIYNETITRHITSRDEIIRQIEDIITRRYREFDNEKIDLVKNPILKRITYIAFPVWDLDALANEFQKMI